MINKVKVIMFGIGTMGSRIAKFVLGKGGLEIVGAIDVAKDKVGRDLGEVLEVGKRLGVPVTDDPNALFSKVKADIVIHATTSYLKAVYPQIAECIKAGMNVVSTCEELSFPYYKHPPFLNHRLEFFGHYSGSNLLLIGASTITRIHHSSYLHALYFFTYCSDDDGQSVHKVTRVYAGTQHRNSVFFG